jgi:energy-converting hydrogenase Eha subunit H
MALRISTQMCQLQLEAEFKYGWCALVTMLPLSSAAAHFILCVTHSKPFFLSLSVLSVPIWDSGREISAPI